MSARIDVPEIYDEVRRAYAGMGYPVSGDRLVVSRQPTYVDGRPVSKDVLAPNSSGGNTQDDGTVRINPRYRAVMRHWGLKGSGRDFLRTIIGHELGHHVDMTVLSGRSSERRRLLREIRKSGFHTVYTDSYGPDTDPRKLDRELLAEYLARQVSDRLGKRADAERIAGAGIADLEKSAGSKAARRLADLIRSGRVTRVTRRMLQSCLANPSVSFSKLSVGEQAKSLGMSLARAFRQAKAKGVPLREYLEGLHLRRTLRGGGKKRFLLPDVIAVNSRVADALDGRVRGREVARSFRDMVRPEVERYRDSVRYALNNWTDGVPRTSEYVKSRGNIFRGNEFTNRVFQSAWPITDPGFATPDVREALTYTRNGGSLSVSDLVHSKSFRTGKSFFTDHVPEVNNRLLRMSLGRGGRPSTAYQVVLPGHEMRGMPWEHYAVFDSTPWGTHPTKPSFYRIVDPAGWVDVDATALRDKYSTFMDATRTLRRKPRSFLRDIL